MEYIISFVLGIVAVVISFVIKNFAKSSIATVPANGIVKKVIYSDAGNVRYYIDIYTDEGTVLKAQSIYYSKTAGKYHVDDSISVDYYLTRNGKVRCYVNDLELIPCKTSFTALSYPVFVIGLILIVVSVVLFIF